MKKLIGGIIVLLFLLPLGYCETLSLGDISVISGLDQKLKAYIQVNNFPKDSNAISWQVTGDKMGKKLPGLKYAIETKDDLASLQVTSQEPIHSPVITINVLANEGKEQIAASEYTVLLDPVTKPVPVDVKQYGPIARGEKLTHVAEKVKPNYITVDNAANALFYANPHAFENNDSSKLIPGSFLVIPEFSPGVSTLGQNNFNEKRFDDLEEQLGLISANVSNIDTDTKRRYDELSAYTLQLETLVTKLDSRLSDLESKTVFMNEDLNQLSKKQEASAKQATAGIKQNKNLISKLEAELTQRWYYLIAAMILIVIVIVLFLWWKRRKENASDEEIILDDYPASDDSGEIKEPVPQDLDTDISDEISDVDDSEEPIATEVVKESKSKDVEYIKDAEYYRQFLKDDQNEENVFIDESEEEKLREAIKNDDLNNDEDEGVFEEEDIPNAKTELKNHEVNIVLDDEEVDESNSAVSSSKDDEIVESNINEFEMDDEIQNTSLNDLEKALENKVKNKENDTKETELNISQRAEGGQAETGENIDTPETESSDKKTQGLSLAPLDLTKKKQD